MRDRGGPEETAVELPGASEEHECLLKVELDIPVAVGNGGLQDVQRLDVVGVQHQAVALLHQKLDELEPPFCRCFQ
jgi:hypothetical protein